MAKLSTFWRSSASYRVRIALNVKDIPHELELVHFRKDGGQHKTPEFTAKNPQQLLPLWEEKVDENGEESSWALNQSLAIIEYLDARHPEPKLIPADLRAAAEVRALSQEIACDIHPLNNLRVLGYLRNTLGVEEEQVNTWYRHWVELGFGALETRLSQTAGDYSYGDELTMVDCCLVPQVYNALRFNVDVTAFPTITAVTDRLEQLPAFINARPENQPDAE